MKHLVYLIYTRVKNVADKILMKYSDQAIINLHSAENSAKKLQCLRALSESN